MLGPAGQLITIESDKEYLFDNHHLIFTIHCIKTNECEVEITTIDNQSTIFPPKSFIQGACYHIYIKKMKFDESKAGFIGYKLLK